MRVGREKLRWLLLFWVTRCNYHRDRSIPSVFFIVKSVGFESDFGIFLLALSAPLVTVARDSKQWESVITHHI